MYRLPPGRGMGSGSSGTSFTLEMNVADVYYISREGKESCALSAHANTTPFREGARESAADASMREMPWQQYHACTTWGGGCFWLVHSPRCGVPVASIARLSLEDIELVVN